MTTAEWRSLRRLQEQTNDQGYSLNVTFEEHDKFGVMLSIVDTTHHRNKSGIGRTMTEAIKNLLRGSWKETGAKRK